MTLRHFTKAATIAFTISKQNHPIYYHRQKQQLLLDQLKTNQLYKTSSRTMSSSQTLDNNNDLSQIRKAKQILRKEIRSKLNSLSQEQISLQSNQVWQSLYKLPQYQSAKSVGLFLSMPKGEICTEDPSQQVLRDGKDLYVPRVGLDFEQCDMDMIKVSTPTSTIGGNNQNASSPFYKDWPKNKWNIPEAPRDIEYELAQPGSIDLLIVPGLAFDRFGGRLGQGKGYYDRFIEKMKKNVEFDGITDTATTSSTGSSTKLLLVAVGLEPSCIDDSIPRLGHDEIMDIVIFPETMFMVKET